MGFLEKTGARETAADAEKGLSLETAHNIAELVAEMSSLARKAHLETIAHLLDLTRLEAEHVVQGEGLKLD